MEKATKPKPKSTNPFDDDSSSSSSPSEENFYDCHQVRESPDKNSKTKTNKPPNRRTNPFESSSTPSPTKELKNQAQKQRHGQQQQGGEKINQKESKRTANLNFDNPFDDVEHPALNFNIKATGSDEFFSPLENAMIGMSSPSKQHRNEGFAASFSFSDDENSLVENNHNGNNHAPDGETSPLLRGSPGRTTAAYTTTAGSRSSVVSELSSSIASSASKQKGKQPKSIPSEISTGGSFTKKRQQRRSSSRRNSNASATVSAKKSKSNLILKYLATGENEFGMDYKYILLEDLGTASSWLILLLPYFAFFLSLLLASSKSIQVTTTGPIYANSICEQNNTNTPVAPCYYYFQQQTTESSSQTNQTISLVVYAFESGVLDRLPVISTYLYGDVTYKGLSSNAVAMVSQGQLESSVQILQQDALSISSPWTLMYSSQPRPVTMICSENGGVGKKDENNVSGQITWDCKTPRMMDILFSMPETAVYAGGDIRMNVFYSLKQPYLDGLASENDDDDIDISHVYTRSEDYLGLLTTKEYSSSSLTYLEEIVTSAFYSMDHMSRIAFTLDTCVRLVTFFISLAFTIYWCRTMGLRSLCCCRREKRTATLWWESPWILFPERCYILVLLVSLLMMQEPLLTAMFFFPQLGASIRLHLVADASIGIGVHGVLFVYLCLFHGFRFHTARVAKKRTEHQRKTLQLRKAAKYVSQSRSFGVPTKEKISEYTNEYYEQFGDIDGSALTGHLRLANDPCADGWADFLLFKVLLFIVGVTSVVATAYFRFPPDDDNVATLTSAMLDQYKKGYAVSIIVQFSVLLIWMYLILGAAIETGRKLKTQPFLSTRPVQLAYRVLFAHMSLGFTALVVSFVFNLSQLLTKWSLKVPDDDALGPILTHHEEDLSRTEIMIRVLSEVARQFPYSGTAASVGSGRIFFATVSILITAFIFLPAHALEEEEDDDVEGNRPNNPFNEVRRLKRDKRLVVHLARESRTWRVFPIPIEQSIREKDMLQDRGYQLYKNMQIEYDNTKERGVVSVGPYTPVFCVELACWLNEASWQAYYSPAGILDQGSASMGGMNLESIGLRLEGAVYDAATDSQAYVATNIAPQVDGDEDSIIVIAFRGTASTSNLQTDLRSRQVPLFDQIAGIGSSPFCIFPDRIEIYDSDGWIWDTPMAANGEAVRCSTTWTGTSPGCVPLHCAKGDREYAPFAAVSKGARAILQVAPVARGSFPRVHQGFQEVYTQIRRKLLDILLPVMQRQLAKSLQTSEADSSQQEPLALPKVYCTGHSLGGSLAQLLALDLASNCEIVLPVTKDNNTIDPVECGPVLHPPEDEIFNLPSPASYQKANPSAQNFMHRDKNNIGSREIRLQPPIAVYTYGQPRVGNKPFARLYKQRVPHTFRVINEGDVITTMPNLVFCGGIYKHSGLAVLLDEGMTGNILVGPTVVETVFRFHQVTTNVVAHTMDRYRDCLECAFGQDELVEYYHGHNGIGKESGENGNDPYTIPDWMTNIRSKFEQDEQI